MAKQQGRRTVKPQPALTLKVSGPDIHAGRIPVPDLLVICQQAQSAVNRQAEALEGRQTLRPGPKLGKVRLECTLELVSLGKGSAVLSFDQTRSQPSFPQMRSLGEEAIAGVGEALRALAKGERKDIDPGVLDSLRSMGELFGNGVKSIRWIVPARPGRRRISATFNASIQKRVVQKLRPPTIRPIGLDGVLEMADFKPSDHRCRIHPSLGPSINCTFPPQLADELYSILRQAAHIEGDATINAQTGKTESIEITAVKPLDPLTVNAGSFFTGWTFDQLVHMQSVDPLRDPKSLAGGWPDDEDVDDVLAEIYQRRE